jgi:hypothetical protein
MIKVLLLLSIAVTLISAKRPSKRTLADNAEQDASEYERSVLHLTVTRAVPDPDAPWSTQNLDVAGHSGIVVGENKVLTQASILSNAVYIQVQKVDDVEKVPMRVVFADYEANLALLSPVDGRTLSGVRVMPVGLDIAIGSDVALLSIENERQLRRADGRAMEVRLREAATSGLVVPMYSIAGLNRPACKSDPVIKKGSLIGICFGVSEGQPLAVTAGVLNHFLKDQLSAETYRGFGNLGLTLHPVRSPWQRKILGVPAGKGALRVSGMSDTSPFGDCVKVDDVLLAVDDIAVDHRGFYLHPRWGMSPIGHYIAGKYAGEALNLRLSRLGKVTNCNRILRRYSNQDRLVPGPSNTASLPHLIFGGLVFQELTVDYLATFGRDWQSKAPNRLLFIYNYLNDSTLTRKRILMLTNVLADEFNTGYEKMTHLILDSVNGRPVNSIDELKIILKLPGQQRSGAEYARFLFKNSFEVVIPYEGLESSHKRIARAYSVSQSSSFFAR